jgi:hypothetical protein
MKLSDSLSSISEIGEEGLPIPCSVGQNFEGRERAVQIERKFQKMISWELKDHNH